MDQSQYSKIENGKVDPQFSTIEKIAKAIKVDVVNLVAADDVFKDVSAYDKTLVEKLQMVDGLEDGEKKSVFSIIDSLAAKKKLKDTLSNALSIAQ